MSRIKTAAKLLFTNPSHFLAQLLLENCTRFRDDETYLKMLYRLTMGKKLDLKNPRTFTQKLQWLKLYDRKDIYTTMVDKYLVKDYVSKRKGEEYIIHTTVQLQD